MRQSPYADEIRSLDGELQLYLDFEQSGITDDDLAALPLPDTVRSISLRDTAITDRGVAELIRAKNLERLNLQGTKITDGAIDHLTQIHRLFELNVGSTGLSEDGQQTLARTLSRNKTMLKYDLSRAKPSIPYGS